MNDITWILKTELPAEVQVSPWFSDMPDRVPRVERLCSKMLTMIEANAAQQEKPQFSMFRFEHSCGTPACLYGYAAAAAGLVYSQISRTYVLAIFAAAGIWPAPKWEPSAYMVIGEYGASSVNSQALALLRDLAAREQQAGAPSATPPLPESAA